MVTVHKLRELLTGILAGVAVATLCLLVTQQDILLWLWGNLGYSLIPFTLFALLYFNNLSRLKQALDGRQLPANRLEHLSFCVDLWSTMFFATGVLWTAIGMRRALIEALGGDSLGASTPAHLLGDLVDGGILLALSTTIVGASGGYCMRLYKTWSVGAPLMAWQMAADRELIGGIERQLVAIRLLLDDGQRSEQPAVSESATRPS
ncbi:MAG: hypothetical protein AAGI88_19270 [Pseudomonadota bacterium]